MAAARRRRTPTTGPWERRRWPRSTRTPATRFAHPELLAGEGLEAWSVGEMWIMGAPDALVDHAVDITSTFDRKIAALKAHASQTAHMDDLEERIRGWNSETARRSGMPEGRLAELFQIVPVG